MGSYCQTIWREVKLIMVHLKRLFCLTFLCCIGSFLHAQSYPTKVVKVIVPSGTSGTMDLLGREFALAFNTQLGKPFIVENKAGAGGNIGMGILANAPADGYTIGLGAANALAARLLTVLPGQQPALEQRRQAFAQRWSSLLVQWGAQAAPLRGKTVAVQHATFG